MMTDGSNFENKKNRNISITVCFCWNLECWWTLALWTLRPEKNQNL